MSCLSFCRRDSHYDPISGCLVSAEVEPIKTDQGLLACCCCDARFKTEHDFCLHQLGRTHQYWLHKGWKDGLSRRDKMAGMTVPDATE